MILHKAFLLVFKWERVWLILYDADHLEEQWGVKCIQFSVCMFRVCACVLTLEALKQKAVATVSDLSRS